MFSLFGGLSGYHLGHQFHSLPLGSLVDGYTIGGKIQVQENHCRKYDNFSVIIQFRKSIFLVAIRRQNDRTYFGSAQERHERAHA